jgi:hypothetical protein
MVEMAGIEPAASTLARRDRSLAVIPMRGTGAIRTRDLLDAIEALYLLSYSPMIWWRGAGAGLSPALPLPYLSPRHQWTAVR